MTKKVPYQPDLFEDEQEHPEKDLDLTLEDEDDFVPSFDDWPYDEELKFDTRGEYGVD